MTTTPSATTTNRRRRRQRGEVGVIKRNIIFVIPLVHAALCTIFINQFTAVVVVALSSTSTHVHAVAGVTLKLALDQNGAVADGPITTINKNNPLLLHPPPPPPPQRFTCSESLDLVHRLRRDCQGVLVGRTTVERDDCSLTVRRVPLYESNPHQPHRIIIDPRLSLLLPSSSTRALSSSTSTSSSSSSTESPTTVTTRPAASTMPPTPSTDDYSIPNYQIFRDGYPTILYHAVKNANSDLLSCLPASVTTIYMPPHSNLKDGSSSSNDHTNNDDYDYMMSPRDIWDHLQQEFGMSHILIEGGPTTARHFLPIIDRILLVRAPITFEHQPVVPSHLSQEYLQQCGFQYLGQAMCDVDTLEYWTRPHLPWPTPTLTDWP